MIAARAPLTTLIGLLLATLPVAAQLSGSATTTGFSGQSGSNRTLSRPTTANEALYAVTISEKSDDPCFLEAKFRELDDGSAGATLRFAECEDSDGDGTDSSRRLVALPTDSVATGVRICLDNDREKLKGLQLIGRNAGCLMGEDNVYVYPGECSTVHSSSFIFGHDYRICGGNTSAIELDCGTLAERKAYVERTNCPGSDNGPDGDWEATVRCPNQKVVTGLKLSTRSGGGGRTMIDGIALECTQLGSP